MALFRSCNRERLTLRLYYFNQSDDGAEFDRKWNLNRSCASLTRIDSTKYIQYILRQVADFERQ